MTVADNCFRVNRMGIYVILHVTVFRPETTYFCPLFLFLQPRALTPAEIMQALGLQQMKNRKWHVQGTIATRGEGLYEGLDWLAATLKQLQRGTPTSRR
jgi:hypothetical protein